MTKSEIRNPKEARNPKPEMEAAVLVFRASDFGFPSGFGIRHSDLLPPA
jgi:hypothetical protein